MSIEILDDEEMKLIDDMNITMDVEDGKFIVIEPIISSTNRKRKCMIELVDEKEEKEEKTKVKCIACSKEEDDSGFFLMFRCFFCEQKIDYCINCEEKYFLSKNSFSRKPCSTECMQSRQHLEFKLLPLVIQEEIGYYLVMNQYIRYLSRILKHKNDALKVNLERYCKNIHRITLYESFDYRGLTLNSYIAIWASFIIVYSSPACFPNLHTIDLRGWMVHNKALILPSPLTFFTGKLIVLQHIDLMAMEDQIRLFPKTTHLTVQFYKWRSFYLQIDGWFAICLRTMYSSLEILEFTVKDYENVYFEINDFKKDDTIERISGDMEDFLLLTILDEEKAKTAKLTKIICPDFNLGIPQLLSGYERFYPKLVYALDRTCECRRTDINSEWVVSKLIKYSTQYHYYELQEKTLKAWTCDKETSKDLNVKHKVEHTVKNKVIETEWIPTDEKIIKELKAELESKTNEQKAIMAIPIKMKKINTKKKAKL